MGKRDKNSSSKDQRKIISEKPKSFFYLTKNYACRPGRERDDFKGD